jgi:H+/Cl- antiporter ClcA
MPKPDREVPPPLEGNDQAIAAAVTAAWAVALIVVVAVRDSIPHADRWWIWTCAVGVGLGVFGLIYMPILKRSRARAAGRRANAS